MIFNNNSKVISFKYDIPTNEECKRFHIPEENGKVRKSVVNIDNAIFYTKALGNYRMINELIGSHLAHKLDLDTVDYEIGKTSTGLHALSKPFYEEGYQYDFFKDYFHLSNYPRRTILYRLNPFSSFCRTEGLDLLRDTEMYESALKLTAIDLKMGQVDRHSGNLQVKYDDTSVSFAPIYDYSESYLMGDVYPIYRSSLVFIRKNRASIEELIRRHPKLLEYLSYLLSLSIDEILTEIGDEKDIEFTGDEMMRYTKSQRLIERPFQKINKS